MLLGLLPLLMPFVFRLALPVIFAVLATMLISHPVHAQGCQLINTPADFPAEVSYAPPYNIFAPGNPLWMQAECFGDYANITIENPSQTPQYVYGEGYQYLNDAWQQLSYTGDSNTVDGWLDNTAQTAITTPAGVTTYVLAFICTWEGSAWKCGCQDTACAQSYWNAQAVQSDQAVTPDPTRSPPPASGRLAEIQLQPGFGIHMFAENVGNARSLAVGPNGTVFVGNRSGGAVLGLVDNDGDMVADEQITISSGMNEPNGVYVHNGDLYVGEVHRIIRYDDIENTMRNNPQPTVVYDQLPTDRRHGWKYVAIGPDNKLYTAVGAPCDICESDEIFATMVRMDLDGSNFEIYARGIRNTVGFDWNPATGNLWFTDNGRDRMGDDVPFDELNRITEPNMHFGYPYCHQGDVPDPEFGNRRACSEFTPPAQNLGPHVASLGMKFYDGTMFPAEYQGDVFIAEHGSWNRSQRIGYRVTHVNVENGQATSYEPFAEGWLQGQERWGRPVDVLVMPDGSLLVSDDYNNAVYRIYYTEQ